MSFRNTGQEVKPGPEQPESKYWKSLLGFFSPGQVSPYFCFSQPVCFQPLPLPTSLFPNSVSLLFLNMAKIYTFTNPCLKQPTEFGGMFVILISNFREQNDTQNI